MKIFVIQHSYITPNNECKPEIYDTTIDGAYGTKELALKRLNYLKKEFVSPYYNTISIKRELTINKPFEYDNLCIYYDDNETNFDIFNIIETNLGE